MSNLDKLANDALLEMIRTPAGRSASVLVELALPQPRIRVQKRRHRRDQPNQFLGFEPQDLTTQAESAAKIEQARELLTEVVGDRPTWLAAAKVFVVEVNGDQLKRLVDSALIRRVYPNRQLKPKN